MVTFRDKYYFTSFRSEFLSELMKQINSTSSVFYLTFSKPVGNILIVFLGNSNPEFIGVGKAGKGITMLFKFNSSGIIEKVLYYGAAYS